jgi:hypothetical protein
MVTCAKTVVSMPECAEMNKSGDGFPYGRAVSDSPFMASYN